MKIRNISISLLCILSLACLKASAETGEEIIKRNGLKTKVEPMLTTHWSQNSGENCLLPFVDTEQTTHAKTGCGATALGQLLYFWRNSIPSGKGSTFYTWQHPVTKDNIVLEADLSQPYDWENMSEQYYNVNTTDVQKKAVGRLMYDLAVALEMNFKENSTATQIEYISTVLKKFYDFNSAMCLLRYNNGAYSMDEWREILYKELSAGRPVLLGGGYIVNENKTANHIFLADGYDEEGRVHFNMGHGNPNSSINKDTYYDLTEYNCTYINDMRMIIGICPNEMETGITVVNNTAGNLKENLGGDKVCTKVCRLKITGEINTEDLTLLSKLAQIDTGQLSYLDLSECIVSGNSIPDDNFRNSYTLQEIILPNNLEKIGARAFIAALGLYKVTFPNSLKILNSYAFNSCRYLGDIHLPASLTSVGTNPFLNCKLESLSIDKQNSYFRVENEALIRKSDNRLIGMSTKWKGEYKVSDGVKTIGSYAFTQSNQITRIVLPSTVSLIYNNAFEKCYSVEEVECWAATAPSISDTPFTNSFANATLFVPSGCKDNYSAWTAFSSIKSMHKAEISNAKMATLWLDYEATLPEGLKAYYADGTADNGSIIKLKRLDDDILPANTGVVLKAEQGDYVLYETEGNVATINNQDIALVGQSTDGTLGNDGFNYYKLTYADSTKNPSTVGFYLSNADGTIACKPYKAYLRLPKTLSAANIRMQFDDEATAIETVLSTVKTSASDAVFNLQGQKVDKNYKGIIVKNGKKLLAR